ncbi:MAG: chemotaxis protein CheW, partial [Cyanobacteria bacterium P01_G01_bin.4]
MEASRQPTQQIDPVPPTEQIELSDESGQIGEQYLRFRLYPKTLALLPIQYLAEIATVEYSAVVPVPGMPAWVSGIYNWRGTILWIVDLGYLLGLTPWQDQPTITDTHSIAILRSPDGYGKVPLNVGAIVQKVEDIDFYDSDSVDSSEATTVSSQMASFLQGLLPDPQTDESLSVLNGAAIFEHLSQ